MAEYLIQDTTLTGLADKIRILSSYEEIMTPAVMEEKLDIVIDKMDDALFLNESTVTANMPSGSWADITCGNGRFVAIRDDAAMAAYSDDGATWISVTVPQIYHSIAYGAGKFVALGGEYSDVPHIAYSEDGITWTEAEVPSEVIGAGCDGFIYGNKFIGIGDYSASGTNNGIISEDGVTWTAINLPVQTYWDSGQIYTYPLVDIAYGNGKYVIIAEDATYVIYSTDGINWQSSPNMNFASYGAAWGTVAYGGGKFVLINAGTNTNAAYSTDAITWTETNFPFSIYQLNWSVAYGDERFVAINNVNDTIYVAYSDDGINWSGYTTTGTDLLGATINDTTIYTSACSIAYDNGKFVVVGKDASLAAISEDGVTWTNTVNNTDIVNNQGTDVTDETIDAVVGDEIDTQTDLIDQIQLVFDELLYVPPVTMISFTIEDTSYQAEEGMTWAEWYISDYNTDSLIMCEADGAGIGSYIFKWDAQGVVLGIDSSYVIDTDEIISEAYYSWITDPSLENDEL